MVAKLTFCSHATSTVSFVHSSCDRYALGRCLRSIEEVTVRHTIARKRLSTAVVVAVVGWGSVAGEMLKGYAVEPAPTTFKIDLDKAVDVNLPKVPGLKPVHFQTTDGKVGWALRLPGNRPIATPAYADGTLFVGG